MDVCHLVSTMKEHVWNADVQEEACSILAQLAMINEMDKGIREAGGVEAILTGMRQHKSDANVQERGCSALNTLARGGNDENRKKIAELGGIDVVREAMQQHEKVENIQLQGCWVLRNLVLNDEIAKKVVIAGGIDLILRAMKEHPSVPDVQLHGCWAVANLATHIDEKGKKEIVRAGAIDAILSGMPQYNHNLLAELVQKGCEALLNLAVNDNDIRNKMREDTRIAVIRDAMKQHQWDPRVQEQSRRPESILVFDA